MLTTDSELLELILQIQNELPSMLSGDPLNILSAKLKTVLVGLGENGSNTEHVVLDSMEAIQAYEPVRVRLKNLLNKLSGVNGDGLLFDEPLGLPAPVEPGPLMKCPRGDNYKVYQRIKGQVLSCRFCGQPLIIERQPINSPKTDNRSRKTYVD